MGFFLVHKGQINRGYSLYLKCKKKLRNICFGPGSGALYNLSNIQDQKLKLKTYGG